MTKVGTFLVSCDLEVENDRVISAHPSQNWLEKTRVETEERSGEIAVTLRSEGVEA